MLLVLLIPVVLAELTHRQIASKHLSIHEYYRHSAAQLVAVSACHAVRVVSVGDTTNSIYRD